MTRTTFEGPLSVGTGPTGVANTDQRGFVKLAKQVDLTQSAARQIVTLPAGSTLTGLGAVQTSAVTGGDDLGDYRVNFGTSADADQYGALILANGTPVEQSKKVKQATIGQAAASANIEIPPGSTITAIGAILTSALAGTDPVSAAHVSFGDGSDINQYGFVSISANTATVWSHAVSSAVLDAGGTIVIAISAQSTTVFTGGGGRAFVEYIVNDRQGTSLFTEPVSGAASFDSAATIVVTLSAAGTTTLTGGGARAFVEYVTVE